MTDYILEQYKNKKGDAAERLATQWAALNGYALPEHWIPSGYWEGWIKPSLGPNTFRPVQYVVGPTGAIGVFMSSAL